MKAAVKQEEANQTTALLSDRIRNNMPKLQHGITVWEGVFSFNQQGQLSTAVPITGDVPEQFRVRHNICNQSCLGTDEDFG